MELEYRKMLKALSDVEEEKNIPEDIILDALVEAMAKAYKKDSGLDDIDVVAEINKKKKTIDIYQNYVVVASDDEVQDDELEIGLDEAREINSNAEVGGTVRRLVEIDGMSRAAVSIAKNVMRQKIREAEKIAVYEEFIEKKDEMVLGVVESVKDKFTLVNLGKTVAMLPHSAQIPNERLIEGQQLRVVITEVNKETKGSQVLVSRADAMLVRRLFEKEVPEIFQGIVEIKAIARDAGERTKMAVVTHNPDVDPIGACIGPRGQRVQNIIEELHGEKVDIFLYSDDLTELVKNALAPAEVTAVLPGDDDKSLLVIVGSDQLSLAIGKRGKNARLAVKLTNHKIDIKTREDIEDMGKDYDALLEAAAKKREEYLAEKNAQNVVDAEDERIAVEERRQAAEAKIAELNQNAPAEEDGFIPEELQETLSENIRTEMAYNTDDEESEETLETAEAAEKETVSEIAEEKENDEEVVMEKEPSKKHADLEEMAANNTYVSRFEKLADTTKKQDTKGKRKFKKKGEEDNFKVSNKELEKQVKANLAGKVAAAQPVYSEEELAEIEAARQAEEDREYDIDYDEYEDYYDEEEN